MKRIRLTLDEETLEAGRLYVIRHETTLSALVRQLLVRTVVDDRHAAVAGMFRLTDAHTGNPDCRGWTREELYVR